MVLVGEDPAGPVCRLPTSGSASLPGPLSPRPEHTLASFQLPDWRPGCATACADLRRADQEPATSGQQACSPCPPASLELPCTGRSWRQKLAALERELGSSSNPKAPGCLWKAPPLMCLVGFYVKLSSARQPRAVCSEVPPSSFNSSH